MAKITKTWSDAGSLPGQYQKLTIEYVSRDAGNVKVKWSLYAKSNGYDYYDYSSRHNKATIYCGKDTSRDSATYQAKGNHASRTVGGTFTITGVGNATTSLNFYYSNTRCWPGHSNSWDPRSTGVVKKTKVGELSIPANKQYTIYLVDTVNNKTYSYSCYYKNAFIVPDVKPYSNYYTYHGWSTTRGAASASIYSGGTIGSVTGNITLYSVVKPRVCNYNFYDKNNKLITTLKHTYGVPTVVPNLDTYSKDVVIQQNGNVGIAKKTFPYKIPGYKFTGWTSGSDFYSPSAKCSKWVGAGSDVNFYPNYEALTNKIIFLTDPNKIYKYKTDAQFNMSQPMSDLGKTDISLRPGYKLVGWCTKSPEALGKSTQEFPKTGIALPNEGYNIEGLRKTGAYYTGNGYKIYPITGDVIFNYDDFVEINPPEAEYDGNQLKLYPYYEYYTTSYVYVDGEWRLAMPYVYIDGKCNMALSYIYASENNWKL